MKVRIKATGEIVDVTVSYFTFDPDIETEYTDGNGNYYKQSELEPIPEPLPEETTISGWVARDKGGGIYLHSTEPVRGANKWYSDNSPYYLPTESFPSVTWETGSRKVAIEIKLSKER